MSEPPFEVNTEIRLLSLEADLAAQRIILGHLLLQLTNSSDIIRQSLEELLGIVKPAAETMPPGKTKEETLQIMSFCAAQRMLQQLSDQLDNPLRPKGSPRGVE